MKRLGLVGALFCLVLCAGAGTRCPLRWVHASNSLTTEANYRALAKVVEEASAAGFNGLLLASGIDGEGFDFHRWNDDRRSRLIRIRQLCATKGMEIIPLLWSVGRSHALVSYDVNLAEAQPVKDVPYVSLGDRAVFEPEKDAVVWLNGRFKPLETATGTPGPTGEVVRTWIERHDVKTAPYRRYRVTFEVRTENVHTPGKTLYSAAELAIYPCYNGKLGTPGREHLHFPHCNSPWMAGCLDFTTTTNVETRILPGFAWKADFGKVHFRNLDVRPLGLQKVIRRAGAPMSVRSAATGRIYEEGRDWLLIGETHPEPEAGMDEDFWLSIPAGSAIAKGEKLLVNAYTAVRRSQRQIGVCMANPALYDCFERSMAAAVEVFGPCRRWFLPMDEIRAGGSCEACRGKGLGNLLADCLTRQRDIIRRHVPNAEIYVWPDMFSPYCNAKPESAGRDYELCTGSFWPISERIPRDIIPAVWTGAKMAEEIRYFNARGMSTIYAGYYDAVTVEGPRGLQAMRAMKELDCQGFVYTTWTKGGKYDLLREYGAALKREFGELER